MTAAAELYTISDVNKGWFIPISFACFAVVVVALWSYVTQTDGESAPDTITHSRQGLSGDPSRPTASGEPAPTPTDQLRERRRALVRALENHMRAWSQSGLVFAETLDHAALRLRSNVGRTPYFQMLAGRFELAGGNADAALRRFDRLLNRHPGHTEALAGRAEALISLKRYQEAANTFERLILIAPDQVRARYNYGVLLTRLAEAGAAAEQFCEVVRIDPRHARAHYNLAALAQREGRLAAARDAWRAFTRLRPGIAGGWFNLGIVLMDFNEPLEAAQAFQSVVHIDPDDPFARLNLALAYEAAGDVEEALDILNQARERAPCNPHIMTALADLHRDIAAWNPAEEETHLAIAVLLEEQMGMLDEAVRPGMEMLAGGEQADDLE